MSIAVSSPVAMLDLSRQYATIGEEAQTAIAEICAAGRFVLGREVNEFEAAAAGYLGANFGVGCASGTDALWLAFESAHIGPGDAVVTSPFTFFASVSSITWCGAQPILADIDPLTFNLSPSRTRDAIAAHKNIRALLPIHLYGQCADWDSFTDIRRDHNLLLIEDAAQAFGARWNGIAAGALGDAAAFSFYPTKNLSAFGDGGLLTTSDEALAERARMLRGHGMRRRYFHDEIGWNSRLDTIQAAVLLIKLRYIESWNNDRRTAAARYDSLFAEAGIVAEFVPTTHHTRPDNAGIVLPFTDTRAHHVWHQYVIRAPRRDDLRAHLTAHGIGSEIYYPLPLNMQQSLTHLGYKEGDFPESERAAREVLALPIYPEIREDEQARVVAAIRSFYR